MTQSNHELNQLKLGQVLLPSGPLTRIECRLAVVEIQKHVNDGVQSQWYRDGRPIAVNGSVFTQHQNGRVVVNLRGNKFKKIIFHFTTFENQASANERLLFAQFNHKKNTMKDIYLSNYYFFLLSQKKGGSCICFSWPLPPSRHPPFPPPCPRQFQPAVVSEGGRGSRWEDRKRCHPPVVPLVTFSHHPSPFLTLSKTDLEEERKRVSPRPL